MSTADLPYLEDPLHNRTPLTGDRIVLGRAGDCDLVIADPRASRYHAELRRVGRGFVLADLQSTNGTRLNDQLVSSPLPLRNGDVIEAGSACLIYHDPEATLDSGHFPSLVLDKASGQVWVDRQPVALSVRQYALLHLLWSRCGLPCSRAEIARAVWPECADDVYDYQIESLVRRLRKKLEADPAQPTLLLTVRGRGYKLAAHTRP